MPQGRKFERLWEKVRIVVSADVASSELKSVFREVHVGTWLANRFRDEVNILAQAVEYGNFAPCRRPSQM